MPDAFSHGYVTLPLLLTSLTIGCTQPMNQTNAGAAGPAVMIQYEGKPLADCHVVLFENVDAVFLERWEGWSDQTGAASLVRLNEQPPAPSLNTKYRAALSSQGDGGWMLEPSFADPKTSPIDVLFAVENSAVIELPIGAVKPL